MATSLALQLKQLAVPGDQATVAQGDTRRVSFIYDHKEAAGIDREMFFYVGVNGLEELCNLDESFQQYESTLFSSSTLYFERGLQTKKVNEKFDSIVHSFLVRVSPFLRFTCAQNALEWLIQKYRVHKNNVDSLIQSFLPYHDTDLFPRMLKLIDLRAHRNKRWAWLLPVQKSGVYLARQTLVNQCNSDPACLALITDMVPHFLRVYDIHSCNRDDRLVLVMNFFCYTLLALVHTVPVTETLLSALLPVMCQGIKSDLKDYKASAYVILSRIMTKVTLKTSLLETIMNSICKNFIASLTKEGFSVLVIMFQSQEIDKITKKSYKRLSRLHALPSILAELSAKYEVSRLVAALFRRLVPNAVKTAASTVDMAVSSSCYSSEDDGWEGGSPLSPLTMMRDILATVSVDTPTRTLAAKLLLENFVQLCDKQDATDRNKTVEKMREVIRIFETKYAECLDGAVASVVSSTREEREQGLVKEFLSAAVSSVHHRLVPGSSTTLALSLLHHRTSVRLNAVTYLMDSLDSIDDKASVKESLLARLQDDDVSVVRVLLNNAQKLWSVFEDKLELTSALLARLKNLSTSPSNVGVVREVMGVLMQGPVCLGLEAASLSYLLLCSPEASCPELAQQILESSLAASSSLLSPIKTAWLPQVKKQWRKPGKCISEKELSGLNAALFDTLARTLATHQSPVQVLEGLCGELETLSALQQKCLACVLLEVTLRVCQKVKDQDTVSRLQLLFINFFHCFLREKKLLSRRPIKSEKCCDSTAISEAVAQLCKGCHLPAIWWSDLLSKWIASLEVPQQLRDLEFWHEVTPDSVTGRWLQAVIRLSLLLHLKGNLGDTAAHHISGLQTMFGSVRMYLCYLCVLWSGENSKDLGVTSDLPGKSLQLTKNYLSTLSDSDIAEIVQSPAPAVPCLVELCISEMDSVRSSALELVSMLSDKCPISSATYRPLLDLITHYKVEIATDTAYMATALTGLKSKPSSRRKSKQIDTLLVVLRVVESPSTPAFIAAALLQALSSIDSMDTLTPLLPLLARLLEQESLNKGQGVVIQHLLARYTDTVAPELAHDRLALQLLAEAIKRPLTVAGSNEGDGKGASVQLMAIAQITKKFFAALPSIESQRCIAGTLLDVLQTTADPSISSCIRKVFKHVTLPADLLTQELAPVLQSAAKSVREIKRMRREEMEEKSTFSSALWIRTTVLLEIMQNKKKIPHTSRLVPFCFQILTKVLEVEDAGEGEYLKQLILGVIHNLCKKHLGESEEKIEGKDLNLDSIVQCIRTSSSPQTHQHALFVLSVAAQIAPEQLVHSMMSVFTFMGASILRQDDSYSFQVITRILETVFPALVMACNEHRQDRVEDMVTMILRVFVDTYPHIPEHRRPMVFTTLLRVVGVDAYLWRLLLVFVEGVTTRNVPRNTAGVGVEDSISASMEQEGKAKAIDQVHVDFLISLVLEFSPLSCVQMTQKTLQYLAKLPYEKRAHSKQEKLQRQSPASVLEASPEECEIFSLAYHTTRQLHKFRHATMMVLQQLLASRNFIAQLSDHLDEAVLMALKEVMETLLVYMSLTQRAVQIFTPSPQAPYWKGLMAKCTMLLDSLVSLLPQDQFLAVVGELLDSALLTVQRKALELLASRLRHLRDIPLSSQQKSVLLGQVPKLQGLVQHLSGDSSGPNWEDNANNGKMALYALMLMARVLGMDYHVTFVEVLKQVSQLMRDDSINSEVAVTAMMCAAEIISNMRAYTIVHLPLVVPTILRHLQAATSVEGEMVPCCVMSLHKVIDTLPHFLTPYAHDILTQVCHIQTMLEDAPASEQREAVLRSLKHASKSMAALSPRVFLPTLETCYNALLESGRQESVGSLLGVLGLHLSGLTREDVHLNHQQLVDFFLTALDFRVTQRKAVSSKVIDRTEAAVIETMLTMVLKMTEGTLRPMLLKIFEWATKEGKRDRVIAFYRLADSLAGRLRGLFLLFAAHIFKHATQLLDLLHVDKAEKRFLKKDKKGQKSSALLTSVLGCVQKVCLFDTQNFINKDRFTAIMQSLLDQLENFVGGEELYHQRVKDSIVPTIADFAAAAKNDSLWQTLNYQLMLKTRSKNKEVRLSALYALKGLHKKLGEDYVSLLPETIPFLSELMEDDCEEVEALTQEVIQEMEETFGEPLQKYFN